MKKFLKDYTLINNKDSHLVVEEEDLYEAAEVREGFR